jgi:hypothetical protein
VSNPIEYEMRERGVYCAALARVILPNERDEWFAYNAWLARGNVPAPMPTPEAPRLDDVRAELRAAVNATRESRVNGGCSALGYQWDTDQKSRDNLSATVAALALGVPLPSDFTWRTADNADVPVTRAQLAQLAGVFLAFGNACYRRSWVLKAQINAAEDPRAVDISTGWPS